MKVYLCQVTLQLYVYGEPPRLRTLQRSITRHFLVTEWIVLSYEPNKTLTACGYSGPVK